MIIVGQQTQELIDTQEDFVVLLNTESVILFSNPNWINYCVDHELPSALWRVGENYLDCLEKMERYNELQCIEDIRDAEKETEIQLSLFYNKDSVDYMSVTYRQFPLNNESKGIILYKHLLTNPAPVNNISSETILESMTDAFFLLDNEMKFYFLNSESEKVLQAKKEELIGRNIWSCFPKAVGTGFYSNFNRSMHDRVPSQFEEYFAPFDFWFSVRAYPVKDGGLAVFYQKTNTENKTKSLGSVVPTNDYLTGWLNRRKFEERIEQLMKDEVAFSLLYINFDNFKHINTLYNHQTGDTIIKKITEEIEKLLLPQDKAGRLDGDELILLRVHQETEKMEDFTKEVMNVFASPIILDNVQPITVNASIGVSAYPENSYCTEELMASAETSMREAKKQNGSSYSIFQPGMGTDLVRRLMIEKSLSGNLKELGYHFAVQPQINCETGKLTGIEVLSRWNHPTLGFISPVEFIGIAEETGTIAYLTNCLLKDVFSFINYKEKQYGYFPKTAINITPSLLTNTTFFEEFFYLMEKYDVNPKGIEIEITESVELTSSEITLANLMACRSKGISIALDDFGTGFSMLAYLVDYPINKIKLDKSFISKIGRDAKSEAVLKSLIQFVKGSDFELLAEGVETTEESLFLQKNGCPLHQGYLHDKPLMTDVFERKYLMEMQHNT